VMGAMADSTHPDDVAVLMLRRVDARAGGERPAAPARAAALTMPESSVQWSGRHAIVTLPAEIDLVNASEAADLLAAVASESPDVITVDMSTTQFCDSAAVHALVRAADLVAARGGELRLALGGSPVARMIQLIGLDQVVPVYRDVSASLAAVRPSERRA
jgi:anti-sigma B factor antagonist